MVDPYFLSSFLSLLLFNFSHFHYCVAVSEIVLLTCIYFHVCLLAIHVSSLIKCLLKTFAHILVAFLCVLLLSYWSSFYNLDTSLLIDVCIVNFFVPGSGYIFIFLTVSLKRSLSLKKFDFSIFFFLWLVNHWCPLKEIFACIKVMKIFQYFFLDIL